MNLMGPRRHSTLVKAAEATVDYLNDGDTPNAALFKAAKAHDLNAKEVALVSHTVNNALTVSHLADSEPEAKADPFPLTNADEVTQELFPSYDEENATLNDPEPGKRPEGEDVESPLDLDPQTQVKKASSGVTPRGVFTVDPDTYEDSGTYHDLDNGEEFIKTSREAFGLPSEPVQSRVRLDVSLGHAKISREFHGDPTHGVASTRLVDNPFTQIRNLEKTADEARTRYSGARDAAYTKLARVVERFRRTDAPSFCRVEGLAKHAGVTPGTLDVVFTSGDLDIVGHRRGEALKTAGAGAGAGAGVALCAPEEKSAVDDIVELERLWKSAAAHYAVQNEVEAAVVRLSRPLAKCAAEEVIDPTPAVKATTSMLETFPDLALGKGTEGYGDIISRATGTAGDGKPQYDAKRSPLNTQARQRLTNTRATADFMSLLDDDYIVARPLPDIVRAYNAAISASPRTLPPEVVKRLVKEQLATGEDIDVQTMLKLDNTKLRTD